MTNRKIFKSTYVTRVRYALPTWQIKNQKLPLLSLPKSLIFLTPSLILALCFWIKAMNPNFVHRNKSLKKSVRILVNDD